MGVWQFIHEKLNSTTCIMLLWVLESKGSSPGRSGFKMAVANDGSFAGTIGGGIMEYKLVEKAKDLLKNKEATISLMQQHHDKDKAIHQSGMICSGSQLIAFVPVNMQHKDLISSIHSAITQNEEKYLQLTPNGILLQSGSKKIWRHTTDTDWLYAEPLQEQPMIHIVGGGHISLALSELMYYLGFCVKVYDDRPGLSTLVANQFADEKNIVGYENIAGSIITSPNDFVVIMTIGYRTDKIVLKQLIDRPLFYLGMLGSRKKVDTLFAELKSEGFSAAQLNKISAPIGLKINSRTTKEIAISIAAEIILNKNKITD